VSMRESWMMNLFECEKARILSDRHSMDVTRPCQR